MNGAARSEPDEPADQEAPNRTGHLKVENPPPKNLKESHTGFKSERHLKMQDKFISFSAGSSETSIVGLL